MTMVAPTSSPPQSKSLSNINRTINPMSSSSAPVQNKSNNLKEIEAKKFTKFFDAYQPGCFGGRVGRFVFFKGQSAFTLNVAKEFAKKNVNSATAHALEEIGIDFRCTLGKLPNDLQIKILTMGNPKDLDGIAKVNKNFRNVIVPESRRLLDMQFQITYEMLKQGKTIQEILSSDCPSWIKKLNLSGKVTNEDLDFIVKNFPNLVSLKLKLCNLTDAGLEYVSKLTKLQTLKLECCHSITNAGLAYLPLLTNLHTLSLKHCYEITDSGLEHVSKITNLQKLNLKMCYNIQYGFKDSAANLTKLHTLNLSGCKGCFGMAFLTQILNLEKLNIIDCNYIGKGHIARLRKWKPTLQIKHCIDVR